MSLESIVRRGPRPAKDGYKVLEDASLAERSEALGFRELVRVDVFASCLASRNKEYVVSHQCRRVTESKDAKNDQCEGNPEVVNSGAKGDVLSVLVNKELDEAGRNDVYRQERGRCDEGEEVAVVTLANTVVEPNAVVVVALDTIVAHPAVMSTRWAPDVASPAVLHRKF